MRSFKRTIATLVLAGAAIGIFCVAATGSPATPEADIGRGEQLVLVIGGTFDTREAAEAASSRWAAEELEGFYLAPSGDFEGMEAGRWLLVSAFRTVRGAAEFEELAAAVGFPDTTRVIAGYFGEGYIGLGQEPNPDGTGPLTGPLPGLLG